MPGKRTTKNPPDPARMVDSLRDTGYEFKEALADIVDNSIDASAGKVTVSIDMGILGMPRVTIADDGVGMNEDALADAMKYGSSGEKKKSRLGKFGMGLKTASTAICRKLSVVTKCGWEPDGIKATWDLDVIAETNDWDLGWDDPTKEELAELGGTADGDSGTLVIWENCDRVFENEYKDPTGPHAKRALKQIVDEFKQHASMVFQRWLDHNDKRTNNLTITVNGEELEPWDPFCIATGDSELLVDETPVVKFQQKGKDKVLAQSEILVRAYVLAAPGTWSSDEAQKKADISSDKQGIYVYRENRLIQECEWLKLKGYRIHPSMNFFRVELSYTSSADRAFNTPINKTKIIPQPALKDYLLDALRAARVVARKVAASGSSAKQGDPAGAHGPSNVNIGEKYPTGSEIQVLDPATGRVNVKNTMGTSETVINITVPEDGEKAWSVLPVEGLQDGILWQPTLNDTQHAVKINMAHDYYKKVYIPNYKSSVKMQGMDALLWALAEAELSVINEATRKHFEELRFQVSKILRNLVEDLPDPDDGDGDD